MNRKTRKKRSGKGYMMTMALPLGFTAAGTIWNSVICMILLVISIFVIAAVIPVFRHRETLGISVLAAICGLPFNIRLSYYVVHELLSLNVIGEILYFLLCLLILLSLEEITLGIISRLIWKKQYRFTFLTGKEKIKDDER